jgi:hypothetical protein
VDVEGDAMDDSRTAIQAEQSVTGIQAKQRTPPIRPPDLPSLAHEPLPGGLLKRVMTVVLVTLTGAVVGAQCGVFGAGIGAIVGLIIALRWAERTRKASDAGSSFLGRIAADLLFLVLVIVATVISADAVWFIW